MKSTTRPGGAATRWWRRLVRRRRTTRQRCRGCGICCDLYGHRLAAGPDDRERWLREGRLDLVRRIAPDGRLWLDRSGDRLLDDCPYLARKGAEEARCRIHDTKPAMCRAYPTRAHGYRCVRGVRFDR